MAGSLRHDREAHHLDPDQEATLHGWAVRAAKRLPVVWDA